MKIDFSENRQMCRKGKIIIVDYMAQLWTAFYSYDNINVEYSSKQNFHFWGGW